MVVAMAIPIIAKQCQHRLEFLPPIDRLGTSP